MLKNMKIGKLLITTFILVSFIASIAGVTSIFLIRNIDVKYSDALVYYGFSQGDVGKAMVALQRANTATRDIIGFTNDKNIQKAKADLEQFTADTDTYLAAVKRTLTSDEEKALFQAVEDALPAYRAKREELIKLGDTSDPVQSALAQEKMVEELDPMYLELYNNLTEIMTVYVNTGNELSVDLTNLSNFALVLNISLVVVAFIISILIALYIAKSISSPLKEVEAATVSLAEGNLDIKVDYVSENELGNLAQKCRELGTNLKGIIGDMQYGLGEMANGNFDVTSSADYRGDFISLKNSISTISTSLSDTLGQINQSADQVSSGSEQVSDGAQALSQGATEQASSIEELAATLADISEQINLTADNAISASERASMVQDEVAQSNDRMKEMVLAMSDISASSGEIAKIIKTIEDIAFQTNILALNAAVEAARAGVAGKGFAVVADEVRNLASKSADASKNTAALIEGSLKAVENGTKIADETAHSLSTVVEGVKDVALTIDKISTASREQAESTTQITTGIDQISAVVQTNSATAEESAAASEELSGQATILKSLVSQFRLKQ